jgi:hypothetical protein
VAHKYHARMSRRVYLLLPIGIAVVTAVYWWLSGEPAGTAMLAVFAIAMVLMGWILLPTAGDVGPTAPVDEAWHEHPSDHPEA